MKSTVSLRGQPLHSMLMVIPAGAFTLVLAFDLVYLLGAQDLWWEATIPLLIGGLIGGILAAIPGSIDLYASVRSDRALDVVMGHAAAAFVLLAISAMNLVARMDTPPAEAQSAVWWSVAAFVVLLVTAALGGRLVYRLGVGVVGVAEEERDPRAPQEEPAQREHGEAGSPA